MPFSPATAYRQHTDDQLVSALQDGNREAFAELYNRYWSPLYRLAYQKLRTKEIAEEIVQDLFVSIWTKRQQATIRELKPYLFTALRFSIINYIESQLVHERFIAYYQSFMNETDAQPDNELGLQDLTKSIEQSLQNLPEKTQQVFRLSRFENLTIPEIAKQMNLSEKAIEYHLSKALKLVRDDLRHLGPLVLLLLLRTLQCNYSTIF